MATRRRQSGEPHHAGYRLQRFGDRAADVGDEAYRQHQAEEERRWQHADREIALKYITGDERVDAYLM